MAWSRVFFLIERRALFTFALTCQGDFVLVDVMIGTWTTPDYSGSNLV